jgi:hypothetical protein
LIRFVVIAGIAIASTAFAQIFTNTYQKSLNCDALQLLYHTSPYIALVREKNTITSILHIFYGFSLSVLSFF